MEFDQVTVCLLVRRPTAPRLDPKAAGELQDAHMAHLARMHDEGLLLAAGPFGGASGQSLRGLSIFRGTPEAVSVRANEDPMVKAGVLELQYFPWQVPAGALRFAHTKFPRSMSEID